MFHPVMFNEMQELVPEKTLNTKELLLPAFKVDGLFYQNPVMIKIILTAYAHH